MDVIARIRAQFTALETGDADLARAAVSPDWVDREASFEHGLGELRGPASLLATGVWLRWGLPDLRFVEQSTVADDRRAISYVLFTGTHTGPFIGFRDGRVDRVIPPTGRRVEVRHAHVYELRDGEVVTHDAVRDDLGTLTQLGMMPPSPAMIARIAAWKVSGRARRVADEIVAAQRAVVASLVPA
ncbi:ester cyclase [Pseudonocardia hydrocarbonoxydans]|uniref:SnoaL-like domain-containing protein n=1 Tax=Pseudonocardia hydrocarbonoxydans TaxID=76726 RepID=A0A4Y3WKM4_9PSEU|nr:ester cyclase [Pseudonocardia hydrocarbonoxydans]GEC19058.1 hypothetical protein PHY01_13410 [Pseudonocardia hydrocarbonoxydans]